MKYFNLSILLFISIFYLIPSVSEAYTMTAGDPVKLHAISSNVYACQARNNYYTNTWGGNNVWAPAPYSEGTRTYFANNIVIPGTYNFAFSCLDDDSGGGFFTASDILVVLPRVPAGLGNSCNVANTQATLSWTAVQYATDYRVVISRPGSGCPAGWANYGASDCVAYPAGNSISFDTQSGFNYNWHVYARTGVLASNSSISSNITCTVPVVPPPLPPEPPSLNYSCNAAGNSVTLSWPAVGAATLGYHVRLDYSSTVGVDQNTNNHPATSITYPVIPGVANSAWVHSVNITGWSPSAASANFTCVPPPPIPPAPASMTPACNAAGNSVTLSWPAVAGASDGYHVRLNYASTPANPDQSTNNHSGTSITYPVIPGVLNTAWIHSVNVSGWTPVPTSVDFTCLPPPPPPAPSSLSYTCNAAGDSVTLSWPAVAGAALGYHVRLDYSSTPANPDQFTDNHSALSVTYPVLPGIANSAWIHSVNSTGPTPVPRSVNFTCTVPATACVAGVAKNWTVGANTCNGLTPLTVSGANGSVVDSTSPTTGSAQFMCNNGVWAAAPQAGSTCTAPVVGTPDLIVHTHNLSTFSNLTQNNPITLAGIMRNNGTLSTGAVVYTNFTYKWGALGAWNDIQEFNKGIVPPTTNTPQDSVVFTPNQAGQLFLQYCVDSRNQINEGALGEGAGNCVIAGPITVSPVVVPPVGAPNGIISVDPCEIAFDATECQTRVVWNSSDFVGAAEVTQGVNVFSTDYSNAGVFRFVSQIDNTFTLRDTGSAFSVSDSAFVKCVDGSVWVPALGKCAILPEIGVVADPDVIRSGERANVVIEIDSEYDLTCVMKDGGQDATFAHVGSPAVNLINRTTRPLNSAQIVTINCTSPLYPEITGSGDTRVNVVPTIQEI